MDEIEHIESTAYRYGRNCKRRECARVSDPDHAEYDALCLALWRELEACGAVDEHGNLRQPYAALYQAGRDGILKD